VTDHRIIDLEDTGDRVHLKKVMKLLWCDLIFTVVRLLTLSISHEIC